ncbi:hypothetical protein LXL04_006821 [Taraxacum kok-saghyz]
MDDCEEYMMLDLENVRFPELCRLLLDEHIGARDFINSHDKENLHGTILHRFVIFISVLLILGLQSISTSMERFGSFIESSLNLWSHYDSFSMLVFSTLRGKNVELPRDSANFVSVIGLTDPRLELDDKIPHEDPRYNCSLAIMAAKTAYENEARVMEIVQNHWKMKYIDFFNCSNAFELNEKNEMKRTTQAFMFSDETRELICVSFRGTSPFSADDWCTDFNLSWYRLGDKGKVHMGFMKALGSQKKHERQASWPLDIEEDKSGRNIFAYYKIRKVLRQKLNENKNARFMVTGHSLGGALAVLFPAILAYHNEFELLERLEGVYTFGQPRVGDPEFCRNMEKLLGVKRYFRFVYSNDLVPRIPFDNSDLLFKHFGYCYYFDSFYNGQVVKEVPNKNYFSIKSFVPMYLNAVLEIVRSFVLPNNYGGDYKEGILLSGVRLFGMIVPGIPAHCPQDYSTSKANKVRKSKPKTVKPSLTKQPTKQNKSLKYDLKHTRQLKQQHPKGQKRPPKHPQQTEKPKNQGPRQGQKRPEHPTATKTAPNSSKRHQHSSTKTPTKQLKQQPKRLQKNSQRQGQNCQNTPQQPKTAPNSTKRHQHSSRKTPTSNRKPTKTSSRRTQHSHRNPAKPKACQSS